MMKRAIVFLLFVSIAYGAEQAIKLDSVTHSVIAPTFSAVAPADFDFTGRTVLGIGGGGSGTVPVGRTLFVDAVNGNDSTGLRGRLDKPFLTITAAIAVALSGDVILVGPGTFNTSAQIVLPSGVSLYGSGMGVTTISSSWNTSANAAFVPGVNSVVADLTISNQQLNIAPVGALTSDQTFIGAIFQRVTINGYADSVVLTANGTRSMSLYDCKLLSNADNVVVTTASPSTVTVEMFNCDIKADALSLGGVRNLVGGGSSGTTQTTLYNCRLTTLNSASPGGTNINVVSGNSNSTTELHDVRIQRDTTPASGTKFDLDASSGGTIKVDNVSRDDGAALTTTGTITYLTHVATGNIVNKAVTYAKIQDVSTTSRFLGRITAGSGSMEELTAANAKTILSLTSGDVGLGNVDNTSDATKNSATATLTNKRFTPRVTSITSSATPTINTDNADAVTITALATAITSMTTNLSGTPNNFDKLIIRIKDDGTARGITWGASFVSSQATLPTTTVISKVTTVGLIWDSVKTKWACIATDQEP